MNSLLLYAFVYPVAGSALLAVLLGLWPKRLPAALLWGITVLGVFAVIVRSFYVSRTGVWGFDHRIFWKVGTDIWAGLAPYAPERFARHKFLNPPSTFPFFAVLATIPLQASLIVWTVLSSILAVALIPFSETVLGASAEGDRRVLSRPELGVLAIAFALSDSCMATIELGQLALFATALILMAVHAQSLGRPWIAGILLGPATMKIGTMLPFLLLFLHRRDRGTWVALAVTVAGLIVLGGQPWRVFDQARAMLHYIGDLSKPGSVNDISYAGPYNEWILGIDHLAYRLGVRGPAALKLVQAVVLLLLGAWLALELVARRIPFGLGLSLVSLYSVVFLYHRTYDAVMVVPALVYAVGRVGTASGRSRWLFAASVLAMFALLYLRRRPLARLTDWSAERNGHAALMIRWFLLPIGTWSILLAMAGMRLAHALSPTGSDRHGLVFFHKSPSRSRESVGR